MNNTEKIDILIIDDNHEKLMAIEEQLQKPSLNIVKAKSGNEVAEILPKHEFALILIDVAISKMGGFAIAEFIRNRNENKKTPIIFVTSKNKAEKDLIRGYNIGCADYLFQPVDPIILKSKVNLFLELYKQKRAAENTAEELTHTVKEFEKANHQIINQQKAVIEEERLKVLLQMAGATAHDLNQPLTALLGNIELLLMNKDDAEKSNKYISRIQHSGKRIAKSVKKFMTIRYGIAESNDSGTSIIDFDQNIKILSVEDSDDDFEILNNLIKSNKKIVIFRVRTIKEAEPALSNGNFDLVFLDYKLPDGTGSDFLNMLDKKGFSIPTVVITGHGNEMAASQVIQKGAYDYIPKNKLTDKALFRIIVNTLEKARLKAEIKTAYKKMAEMSSKDELTGLYNRRYFMEALEREVSRAKRYKINLSLCMIDLDHFKLVNDTYGHPAGDMVLSKVGSTIKNSFRQSDLACRYGGEEFAVILPDTDSYNAKIVAERFRKKIYENQFEWKASKFKVTTSIGFTTIPDRKPPVPSEMVSFADQALFKAKKTGRNKVIKYETK